MAKTRDPDSSDTKKKRSATGKKAGAPAKKRGRSATTRSADAPLVEKSKHPLSYLIPTKTDSDGDIWLCWPDGSVTLETLCGSERGLVLLIEKSKGG